VRGRGFRDRRPRTSTDTPQPLCKGGCGVRRRIALRRRTRITHKKGPQAAKRVKAQGERSRDSSAETWGNWSAPDASQLDEVTGIAAASTSAMLAHRARWASMAFL